MSKRQRITTKIDRKSSQQIAAIPARDSILPDLPRLTPLVYEESKPHPRKWIDSGTPDDSAIEYPNLRK